MLYGRASYPSPTDADGERLGWQRLLAFLARDGQSSGTAYEQLRVRLIRFFRVRGAAAPEELADATFDRVARKLSGDLDGTELHPAYFFGVARLIWRESLRREHVHRRGVSRLAHSPDDGGDDDAPSHLAVWQRCLDELPDEARRLLVEYYDGSGQERIERRQALVRELGIDSNSLRARIHRLRLRLEQRVAELAAKEAVGEAA
jgi:DNA-directed RNA polymerase specialized sigma24 family protein